MKIKRLNSGNTLNKQSTWAINNQHSMQYAKEQVYMYSWDHTMLSVCTLSVLIVECI